MARAGWSRSPKHLLREGAVSEVTRDWEPGSFTEFGVGTGTMTRLFVDRGFTGTVFDIGPATRESLRAGVFPVGGPVTVVDHPSDVPDAAHDYLMAFEVLEHVEDDGAVLSEWSQKLRPGGRVLLSVPAHMHKFSATDRRVGHVRRYERDGLADLMRECNFVDLRIVNYGFPLGNVSRRVMSKFESGVHDQATDVEQVARSVRSGVEQPSLVNQLSRVINPHTVKPFVLLQRRYFDLDRGDGYIATGRLKSAG